MSSGHQEREQAARRKRRKSWAIWSTVAVVAVIVFIVLARLASGGPDSSSDTGSSLAPAALVAKLASLPASLFEKIGQGSSTVLPKPITAPALTKDGKPEIIYYGAEYCPYCATQRWPMAVALMRFGTFTNLRVTHSSSTDVYPSTQTLSFHASTYKSDYIVFSPVEMQTNQSNGSGGYTTLDTPTAEQTAILNTYNVPPYVDASSAGAIPFVYYGGQYIMSGTGYSPQLLQGLTHDQIAAELADPNSEISKGAIGSANIITATICSLTGNQPGNVCNAANIQAIQKVIKAQ